MVDPRGFKPLTFCLQSRRSIAALWTRFWNAENLMNVNSAHCTYRNGLPRAFFTLHSIPKRSFYLLPGSGARGFSLTATQTDCQNRTGGSCRFPSTTPQSPLAVSFLLGIHSRRNAPAVFRCMVQRVRTAGRDWLHCRWRSHTAATYARCTMQIARREWGCCQGRYCNLQGIYAVCF